MKNYFWTLKPTWAVQGVDTVVGPDSLGQTPPSLFIVSFFSPLTMVVYLLDTANVGKHEDIKWNQEESGVRLPQCPMGNIVKVFLEDDIYSAGSSLSLLAGLLAF